MGVVGSMPTEAPRQINPAARRSRKLCWKAGDRGVHLFVVMGDGEKGQMDARPGRFFLAMLHDSHSPFATRAPMNFLVKGASCSSWKEDSKPRPSLARM